jgi:hypothetical protein
MAYDQLRICNVALSHCASQRFLAALDDGSTEGDLCDVHYEPARDEVLAALRWPFANRFVELALVEEADEQPWASEWGYAYRYPADCVSIRRITTGNRRDGSPVKYELGSDSAGKLILTDEADAVVAYTHAVTDVTLYPDVFCQAVAWRMAWHMAMPLTGRTDLRAQADQEYQRVLADAKVSVLVQQQRDEDPDAEWIRARGG